MGVTKKRLLQLNFDRHLKLEFRGATITSDAGLITLRKLDEMFRLSQLVVQKLAENRQGMNIQHQFSALFRQAVFRRLAGYEDVNDAEHLRLDPTMRAGQIPIFNASLRVMLEVSAGII